jgi:1-aminocyclopropane-1-carboxylate deaminase/D-cysteine desulfhydrase-like pyridoxal-dependent ACC family enzyme
MSRPLFEYFPALEKALPWIELANLPTPVEAFTYNSGNTSSAPNLWIKRDDQTSGLYGGNKVRKLEFVLAQAMQQGKMELVTFGAIGTNHGVATALFCQQQGIKCKVLLFDQPITAAVQDNLKLMQQFGAQLEYSGTLFRTVLRFYWDRLLQKNAAYYLFAGGSNVAGCIGFINAALELKQQIEQGLTPEPDLIYCPVGSNSTAAGLSLGCQLAGLKSRVVGVRVAPSHLGIFPACTTKTIHALMVQTYDFLKQQDGTLPDIDLPEIRLEEGFYGDGYGHPLKAGQDATELFGHASIKLEPTYTAKTAAAVLQQCIAHPEQTVLYWHTYNSADMSEFLTGADTGALPAELHRIATLPVP